MDAEDDKNSHRCPVFLADGLEPNENPPPVRHEASGFFEFNGVFFQALFTKEIR
ncbi:hypothetical protein [Thiococcus pfennigii]|uniref:hypothetical protein n=1 Tax=Thiococcus pfennigii TaxID=1057 RepID=UPI0019077DA6|nr:hypothetical protein [Thiococcus pfennigii]